MSLSSVRICRIEPISCFSIQLHSVKCALLVSLFHVNREVYVRMRRTYGCKPKLID